MKITDDRGVEREERSGVGKVRGVAMSFVRTVIHLGVVVTVVLAGLAASCFGASWVLGVEVDHWSAAVGGVVVATGMSLIAVPFFFSQRKTDGRDERSSSSVGLCRTCGYDLSGLAIEADGCRVCPECGAAWRVKA